MRIETLIPAATDALLLDEVRNHLRIGGADDDATLATLARTAEGLMEAYLGAALVARDTVIYLDGLPECTDAPACWWQGTREGPMSWATGEGRALLLPLRPLIALSEIAVWQAGAWQVWDSAHYSASLGIMPSLQLAGGALWPRPQRASEGIRITARFGFGENWNAVPATIRHALLQLVAWLYTHKGDEDSENAIERSGAAAMVASFRKVRL